MEQSQNQSVIVPQEMAVHAVPHATVQRPPPRVTAGSDHLKNYLELASCIALVCQSQALQRVAPLMAITHYLIFGTQAMCCHCGQLLPTIPHYQHSRKQSLMQLTISTRLPSTAWGRCTRQLVLRSDQLHVTNWVQMAHASTVLACSMWSPSKGVPVQQQQPLSNMGQQSHQMIGTTSLASQTFQAWMTWSCGAWSTIGEAVH